MIATGTSAANAEVMVGAQTVQGRSLWVDARRRLFRNKAAVVSMVVLAIITLVAIFLPLIWPYAYEDIDYALVCCAPDWWPDPDVMCHSGGMHWFGSDSVGRDLFVRVLYGARVSLAVGLVATLVSLVIGVAYGATAGFHRRRDRRI